MVAVRGRGTGRVNVAGAVCYRPGHRPRFIYKLHVYHGRKNEPKSFSWHDYRDLIIATHHALDTPIVWCWDNLNIHLMPQLNEFARDNKDWLRVFRMPTYAPELNPAEGIWSLLKRSIANFVAPDLTHLARIMKRRLKKIQYRPHAITGCLTATGLTIEPETTWLVPTSST